jgi:ferredoxin
MRVRIARDLCVGAGQCERSAPEVFAQDDSGLSRALTRTPPAAQRPAVHEAAGLCPVGAVVVTEDGDADRAALPDAHRHLDRTAHQDAHRHVDRTAHRDVDPAADRAAPDDRRETS